jgi:hypothetical protein
MDELKPKIWAKGELLACKLISMLLHKIRVSPRDIPSAFSDHARLADQNGDDISEG